MKTPADNSYLNRYDAVRAVLLAMIFAAVYHSFAVAYEQLPGFTDQNNVLFGADQLDARDGWVEHHKGIHPLVLLVVVPTCRVFSAIAGSYDAGLHLFAAMTGGLAVGLFYCASRLLSRSVWTATAVTSVYGLSMSQLVFGGLADTYVLAAASSLPSIILMLVCLRDNEHHPMWWIAACTLSFAVTLTMFFNSLVCLAIVLCRLVSPRQALVRLLQIQAVVLSLCVVLSFAQKALYPDAQLFFVPSTYEHELEYTSQTPPSEIPTELVRNFLFHSVLGTQPSVQRFIPETELKLVYCGVPLNTSGAYLGLAGLWLVLWTYGTCRSLVATATWPVTASLGLALTANLVLHSFYNTREIFLCSPHFTFLVLLLPLSHRIGRLPLVNIGWTLLAGFVALSNPRTIDEMLLRYGPGFESIAAAEVPLIPDNARWQYWRGTRAPGADWDRIGFDAQDWEEGRLGIGYGDGDDRTSLDDMRGRYTTVFVRRVFNIDSAAAFTRCWMDINFDDGFVASLNGVEFARWNAPSPPEFDSTATREREAARSYRFFLPDQYLVRGENVLAITVLNHDPDSSDLSLQVKLRGHRVRSPIR